MSTAKKAAVKKVVRKAAARNSAAAAARVIDEDGAAVADDVDAQIAAAPAEGTGEADNSGDLQTITLALSYRGKRTGKTRLVRVHRPTDTQIVWFEAAAHRFDLVMEAWREGAELSAAERGEAYNDALNAMNVFVATRHDRAWIDQAMAAGVLELDALIEGINAAKDALGLGEAAGADVVVA